jgi:hypothetical protein
MKRLIALCVVCVLATSIVAAKTDPWIDAKMHHPQLPDYSGWDVGFNNLTVPQPIADDWQCTGTGAVSDIHLWLSWLGDEVAQISALHVAIYSDKPFDQYTNPFSTPDTILWERTISPVDMFYYGSGDQGFFNPLGGPPVAHDHDDIYQINITNISDPFIQQQGTIYWLAVNVSWDSGEFPDFFQPGWKTSEDHFNDGAVYMQNGYWMPLVYPQNDPLQRTGNLDLAFVITPEPTTICLLGLGALSLIRRKRA